MNLQWGLMRTVGEVRSFAAEGLHRGLAHDPPISLSSGLSLGALGGRRGLGLGHRPAILTSKITTPSASKAMFFKLTPDLLPERRSTQRRCLRAKRGPRCRETGLQRLPIPISGVVEIVAPVCLNERQTGCGGRVHFLNFVDLPYEQAFPWKVKVEAEFSWRLSSKRYLLATELRADKLEHVPGGGRVGLDR